MKGLEHVMSGTEACATIRKQTDTVLLSFSCGKDAIAAWLEVRRHFPRVIPFYLYNIPNLGFVERALKYYEGFFGCRIHRLPQPTLYMHLRNFMFQPPRNVKIIQAADLENFSHTDIEQSLREDLNLGPEVYVATGVRASDSARRALAIRRYGPITHSRKKFHPVWDWNKDRLINEMVRAGVKLPADYTMFPRSFDGINAQYLVPIKKHFPEDYERILRFFPMADIEIFRAECGKENV